MSGLFFVFDGMDGAGKSTAIRTFAEHLKQAGYSVVCTREPGGCDLAEEIRACMLKDWAAGMPIQTELLLVFAARAAHMAQTILPALARGEIVLCDRFVDSSYVYQSVLGGVDAAWIDALVAQSVAQLPNQTLIFDLPLDVAEQRLSQRGRENRFDHHDRARLQKVRLGFQARVQTCAATHIQIDAAGSPAQVQQQVLQALMPSIEKCGSRS